MKDVKQEILAYSADKFIKHGFFKTSMDEIARGMEISKKTLYKYFDSKSSLVSEVSDYINNKIHTEIDNVISNSKLNTVEKFMILASLDFNQIKSTGGRYMHDIQLHEPEIYRKCEKFRKQTVDKILMKLIQQGKKEKILKNYPSDLIITTLDAVYEKLFSSDFIFNSKYSSKQISAFIVNSQLSGILTDKGIIKYKKNNKKIINEQNLEV